MSTEAIGIIVALLAQAIALGFWGGGLSRLVKQHDAEINADPGGLRAVRHLHANTLTEHEGRLHELEQVVERRRQSRSGG